MSSFSLAIEYLTGYAVATDPANREEAEWPPHPARVYMALAAAHFETDPDNTSQRATLDWLATLPPPDLSVPAHALREVQTVYVPVNDQSGGEALLKRSRQPRFFPRVYIGSEPLRLTWHTHEPADNRLGALDDICRNVTRIGHSSSLVWVRLERNQPVEPTHVPDDHLPDNRLRIPQPGTLQRLEDAFNKSAIDEFAILSDEIRTSKGKAKSQLQQQLKERFPRGQPISQRPASSISQGYRPVTPPPSASVASLFDPNFIVLSESDDATQTYGLESTARITDALRGLIMSKSKEPMPPWAAGHEPNGDKLTSQNHLALVPLAFVGGKYADGHLLGVGIVLPRDVPYRERAKVLAPILFDEGTNQPRELELKMGRAGVWKIVRETNLSSKQSLRTLTYTSANKSWASVTPVLLDRVPKTDRGQDPLGWRQEVVGIVAKSCQNVGLPVPISVRIEKTPFFNGSMRAMPGQGGFPQLRKDKFQVHVQIDFDCLVQGPILLGAGRYRGYGLMRPWNDEVER